MTAQTEQNSRNEAPRTEWVSSDFGHTVRQRLYVQGSETPFFIDTAHTAGHKSMGEEHGLYGAGMSKRGCAELLDCGPRIAVLKHRAEQMAFERVSS